MKIVSWNVNGFRSACQKGLPEFLRKEAPDLVCLQEVKADETVMSDPKNAVSGYSSYHSFATKRGYSGVTTLVRNDLLPKAAAHGIGTKHFDDEGRFLILSFTDFDLYNTYYPSGTTGELRQAFKYKFLDALYDYLKSLPPKQRNRIVMCGDFNICHRPIDIHHPDKAEKQKLSGYLPDERRWMDRFQELGFVDTFRHVHGDRASAYTWWSFRANSRAKNLGWRIDYIWVAKALAERVQTATIYDSVRGSDHCPISVELKSA